MHVKIGKYTNWVGPYQLAELLKYVGVRDEDTRHDIGTKLSNTWVNKACQWIHNNKKRKIKVKIDYYDTWSADSTLSHIVYPMLLQLKETKHGAPFTSDDDVPEELKSTSAPPKENEWDTDGNHFKRWDYILDEMIWAFSELSQDRPNEPELFTRDKNAEVPTTASEVEIEFGIHELKNAGNNEAFDAYHNRMKNGFRLFGTYFQNLWD